MDIFTLLALACFLAAAIVAGAQRAWPLVLLSAGAFFALLAGAPIP